VANATVDLLLLGAWAIALESIEGEQIPVSDWLEPCANNSTLVSSFIILHEMTEYLRLSWTE
jgi:hypothetical protein